MRAPGSRTLWDEGHQSGREVVTLGVALALSLACLDLGVTGHLSALFDLGFVLVCLALALAVRPADFFTVGVLPPLLMLATFVLIAISRAQALASAHDGLALAVVTGLGHHAPALALGYLGTLGVLALRRRLGSFAPRDPRGVTRTDRGPRLPVG